MDKQIDFQKDKRVGELTRWKRTNGAKCLTKCCLYRLWTVNSICRKLNLQRSIRAKLYILHKLLELEFKSKNKLEMHEHNLLFIFRNVKRTCFSISKIFWFLMLNHTFTIGLQCLCDLMIIWSGLGISSSHEVQGSLLNQLVVRAW